MREFKIVSSNDRSRFCLALQELVNDEYTRVHSIHYYDPHTDNYLGYNWYEAIVEYEKATPVTLVGNKTDAEPSPVTPPDNYYWDHVVD